MRSSRFSFAPVVLLLAGAFAPLLAASAAVPIPKPPTVPVRAYILVDYATGRVLAAMNPDAERETDDTISTSAGGAPGTPRLRNSANRSGT